MIAALGLLLTLSVAEARSPDFSGVWERYPDPYEGGIDYPPPPGGPPDLKEPYASAYKTAIQKRDDAVKRGEPLTDASTRCMPEGMPTMMAGTYDLEFLHGKDDVAVLAEFLSQTRRIFFGTSMPPADEISPSYNGFSVGHWEGDTLVVQTAGVRVDVQFMSMPHSKNMRITERIRLVAPDKLEDRVVIEDPEVFAKPYAFTFGYRRDQGYRIGEYICDNNRWQTDENGRATLVVATDEPPAPVKIDEHGTVHVTEIAVPLSSYMSWEARESLIALTREPPDPIWEDVNAPIEKLREQDELASQELVKRAKKRYAVNIDEQRIGGVRALVVTPKAGVAVRNKQRVLVELHGGGFFTGANAEALLESIPVASVGGFKVIAVDYRQGPEHRFPAASEDVASVYKELLKQYNPADIGLFGCSAGGTLSAMAVAWFQKVGLPKPGAIGLFSSGAYAAFNDPPDVRGAWGGDSRYTAPPLVGESLWPADPNDLKFPAVADAYLKGVDRSDPLASPALHPAVLAGFPPTLLITSSRGFDMGAAVQTHRELVKAGVDANLHVWDGVGHCFFVDVDLPESREAFSVMTKFFDRHLGR